MRGAIITILVSAAIIIYLTSGIFAHEFWINKGKYVGADKVHCCGPKDCFPIEKADVRESANGYVLKTYSNEVVPFTEATPSEPDPDGETRFWRCQKADGTRRCFFAPYGSY
jgi:hypothetical protein